MSAPASTPSRHATHQFSRRNGLPARSGQESQSSLWLPGEADEGENRPADDPVATRRILVVDVAGDAAASLVLLLRNWRHQVRAAHDGPAALAAWDGFRPELVLLEIDLPGMEGYEVARRLWALPGVRGRAAGGVIPSPVENRLRHRSKVNLLAA